MRMDAGWAGLLITLFLLLSVLWFLVWRSDTKRSRLPPGPAPWPILGNLLQKDVLPLYRHYEKVRDKWPCWTHSQPLQDTQWESPIPKQKGNPTGDPSYLSFPFFPTSSFALLDFPKSLPLGAESTLLLKPFSCCKGPMW